MLAASCRLAARGSAYRSGLRSALSRLAWVLLFLGVLVTLAVILPGQPRGHKGTSLPLSGLDGSGGGGDGGDGVLTAARRQVERQRFGRAQRTYVKGACLFTHCLVTKYGLETFLWENSPRLPWQAALSKQWPSAQSNGCYATTGSNMCM